MSAVIYSTLNGAIVKQFDTLRGAKGSLTRMAKRQITEHLRAVTGEEYEKTGAVTANEKVTVYSIFDLKRERPIEIRRAEVGTCCDPSTERYHTM